MRFANKVALVTGAGCVGPGWGNGRAMAVRLAQEGAQVWAVDFDPSRLAQTLALAGEHAQAIHPFECDVTDSASVKRMVQACAERLGGLDILINNVGGSAPGGPVEMSEDLWDAQINFNLKSVFLTCKHALPWLKARGGGAIVNMASTSGIRWTGSAQVAYAAAKAGVIQMSKVMAIQHAADHIRVNTVVPGQLHTPMVESRLAGQRAGGDVQALLNQRLARIPLGFMGDGRDSASAALFLASEDARFITGTEIVVDGGMTVRCG